MFIKEPYPRQKTKAVNVKRTEIIQGVFSSNYNRKQKTIRSLKKKLLDMCKFNNIMLSKPENKEKQEELENILN